MKRLATALVAAGALIALSACAVDPYGTAYYGDGLSGSSYGAAGDGYYRYSQPYSGYQPGYGDRSPYYRDRYDRSRYRRY